MFQVVFHSQSGVLNYDLEIDHKQNSHHSPYPRKRHRPRQGKGLYRASKQSEGLKEGNEESKEERMSWAGREAKVAVAGIDSVNLGHGYTGIPLM